LEKVELEHSAWRHATNGVLELEDGSAADEARNSRGGRDDVLSGRCWHEGTLEGSSLTTVQNELLAAGRVLREGKILAFTGAGISTESGIPDFRGPGGLWSRLDPADFHINRFVSDPEIRKRGWALHQQGQLWGARSRVRPNRGHLALVDLWQAGRMAGCVTQNIDGLHQAAGLPDAAVAELHGNTRRARCLGCEQTWPTETVLEWVDAGAADPVCPDCGGIVKTATVMFGEVLPPREVDRAWEMASSASAVLAIGSTLSVWPAAEIPARLAADGRPLVIVNQGPTEMDHVATIRLEGAAGVILPALVSNIVGQG
jgi:NAD-dependent deacetylase